MIEHQVWGNFEMVCATSMIDPEGFVDRSLSVPFSVELRDAHSGPRRGLDGRECRGGVEMRPPPHKGMPASCKPCVDVALHLWPAR